MMTCTKCGKEGPDHWFEGTAPKRRCEDHLRAELRAELRDVKAERDELVRNYHSALEMSDSELRDLRAAVLLIAKRMEDGGPASSDLLCIWANELRKAVT